jgi:hypothetical protein
VRAHVRDGCGLPDRSRGGRRCRRTDRARGNARREATVDRARDVEPGGPARDDQGLVVCMRLASLARGNRPAMLLLFLLLAALVVAGVVLAIVVIKWLFILAVVAALVWLILFFVRRIA